MNISEMAVKTECRVVEQWMNSLGRFATLRVDEGLTADLRAVKAGTRFMLGLARVDGVSFRAEVKIVSSKSNTRGHNISFVFQPDDIRNDDGQDFIRAPFNDRWSVVWLELDDEDAPQQGELARDMQRAKTSFWRLLQNPDFGSWISWKYSGGTPLRLNFEDAQKAVYKLLDIEDPAELETNRTAYLLFRSIRSEFYKSYVNGA
jgi:hypothetical protein